MIKLLLASYALAAAGQVPAPPQPPAGLDPGAVPTGTQGAVHGEPAPSAPGDADLAPQPGHAAPVTGAPLRLDGGMSRPPLTGPGR